jgi:hypothetical protein
MTNLFGCRNEPFSQQASTNLLKFVILLHQPLDGYVMLFQVYEYVINADKLCARIPEGERHFRAGHRHIAVDKREHLFTPVLRACHGTTKRDSSQPITVPSPIQRHVEPIRTACAVAGGHESPLTPRGYPTAPLRTDTHEECRAA